jgi:fatty-acyl-CoA synthase
MEKTMGFGARLAREWRYFRGLAATISRIYAIKPSSDVLVCDDFERAVDRFADRTAIRFEGRNVTYAQLDALANRFAHWAEQQGLKRGETVALLMQNRIEYVAAWMGLAKRGVATALINTHLAGAALAHCLSISGADHVITDCECASLLETMRQQLARPLETWIIDPEEGASLGEHRRALLLSTGPCPRPDKSVRAGMKAGDVALYIFTSGTTGMPKAAKITHARAQLYMRAFAGATHAKKDDRIYCALPLYHSTGGLCGVGAALLTGACLVLKRKFSASQFWSDIAHEDCTLFVYIGELCRYLVNQPVSAFERAHRVKRAFGNGLRPEVWTIFQERFRVPHILEFYGSTEGNGSLLNFDGKPGAVGRVAFYAKIFFPVRIAKFDLDSETPIRNARGFCEEAPSGEPGELIGKIKNQNYVGYADKAASEKKVLRDAFAQGDAWFRTGDLMRQDKDGYFYFVDRIGDTFRWKGENVSTTEVSEALSHYPGVAEVNVYGVAVPGQDGRAGMAAITPGDGFNIAGLRAYLGRELPFYARPVFIRIQPAIETTGTFKYRKVDLVNDGFDPHKIEQTLYVALPESREYTLITPSVFDEIRSERVRL